MDYTEGTTVSIAKENKNRPVNLTVMLQQNDLRGVLSQDGKTYYVGSGDNSWCDVFSHFGGIEILPGCGEIRFRKNQVNPSLSSNEKIVCRYFEFMGVAYNSLGDINIKDVFSVTIVNDGTENVYGADARYGAVIMKARAFANERPVERTDFEAKKAKRIGGEEGMKAFIATQGKGLEYEDGKIIIDGKMCNLYIVNDRETRGIRGIEANMIDDIIIVRTGAVPAYGTKAENGVVLISATKKEKMVVDENNNTVTAKEAKKAQKKAKK